MTSLAACGAPQLALAWLSPAMGIGDFRIFLCAAPPPPVEEFASARFFLLTGIANALIQLENCNNEVAMNAIERSKGRIEQWQRRKRLQRRLPRRPRRKSKLGLLAHTGDAKASPEFFGGQESGAPSSAMMSLPHPSEGNRGIQR
jgi:hypothetical protein